MIVTKLYIRTAKGSGIKPGELCVNCSIRSDYIVLPSGDAIGVVHATSAEARDILTKAGAVVLDPLHRPIKDVHVKAFGHAGAQVGDTGYDVAEKLFNEHKMFWMHPENSVH